MRNFTKYVLAGVMMFISSTVMLAQLSLTHTGAGKLPPPSGTRAVLYEQMTLGSGGYASQDFEAAYNAYDCEGTDDFIVPANTSWTIQTITAPGSGSTTAALANVVIYADCGGMPVSTPLISHLALPATNSSGTFTINIPQGGITLGPGRYWLTIQDAAPFVTYGQWWWYRSAGNYGYGAYWRNPGNGFGS